MVSHNFLKMSQGLLASIVDHNYNPNSYSFCHQDLCKRYEGQYMLVTSS